MEKMDKIKIGEKEFGFKLTLESWKRLKESGITPGNLQKKIDEDMAGTISALVFYGLSPDERKQTKQEEIDLIADLSIANQITEIVKKSIEGEKKDDEPKN
jgi:hypothetical protein